MTPGVDEWRQPEIVHDVVESWGAIDDLPVQMMNSITLTLMCIMSTAPWTYTCNTAINSLLGSVKINNTTMAMDNGSQVTMVNGSWVTMVNSMDDNRHL